MRAAALSELELIRDHGGGVLSMGLYLNSQYNDVIDVHEAIDGLVEQTVLAAELGFDTVWAGEHHLTAPDRYIPQIPLLSRVAGHIGAMTLGTNLLLLPLHSVLEVAEQASFLDQCTKGRFVLGVGQGYREVEFDALGTPFAERARRLETGIRLLRRLWSENAVESEEPWCRLRNAVLSVPPYRLGGPQIWLGATRARGIRRIAELVDGFMMAPNVSISEGRHQVKVFRNAIPESGGRHYQIGRMLETFCHESDGEARRLATAGLKQKYGAYATWGLTGAERFRPEQISASFTDEGRFAIGDPDQVARILVRQYTELGVTSIAMRIAWPGSAQEDTVRCLRLLGQEVLPKVREQLREVVRLEEPGDRSGR